MTDINSKIFRISEQKTNFQIRLEKQDLRKLLDTKIRRLVIHSKDKKRTIEDIRNILREIENESTNIKN